MLVGKITSDNELFQYFHDGLGSITMICDSSGTYQNLYTYYDFGDFRKNDESVSNSYCYTGQERDEEPSGLYNLRARYYAAGMGRFTQEDPVDYAFDRPQRMNLYTYVMNDTLNKLDPLGLYCISLGLATPGFWEKTGERVTKDTGWQLTQSQLDLQAASPQAGVLTFLVTCVWYREKTIVETQTRIWRDYEACFDHCGIPTGIRKKYSFEERAITRIEPKSVLKQKLQSFFHPRPPQWICNNSWVLQP